MTRDVFDDLYMIDELDEKDFPKPLKRSSVVIAPTPKKKKAKEAEVDVIKPDDKMLRIVEDYIVVDEAEETAIMVIDPLITNPVEQMFFRAYMETGVVTRALKRSGMAHSRYKWLMEKSEAFRVTMEACLDAVCDKLEAEGMKRALMGSDKLLIKFLEAYRPEKFAQRRFVQSEGTVDVNVTTWAGLVTKALESKPEAIEEAEFKEVEE